MKKLMAMGMMATLSLCIFTQSAQAVNDNSRTSLQPTNVQQDTLINLNTASASQ